MWQLVSKAGMPLLTGSAVEQPWWWARIAAQESHLQAIQEIGAMDVDKMIAPKEFWPLSRNKDLKEWIEERERIRKSRNGILDDE